MRHHPGLQAEALSALLGTAKGGAAAALTQALRAALPHGANAFAALASAVVVPTVLLPGLLRLPRLTPALPGCTKRTLPAHAPARAAATST